MNAAAAAEPVVEVLDFRGEEWLFFPAIVPTVAIIRATTADGRGKNVLDAIRGHIRGMQDEERRLLEERSHAAQRAGRSALSVLTVGGGLIVVLALAAIVRARNLVPAGSS